MGKNQKKTSKFRGFSVFKVKLSFHDGYAEYPIYSIKALTTEKDKGMNMLELIEQQFGITKEDRKVAFIVRVREEENIWTRDEKGNIISPFSKKIKQV